MIRFLIVKTNDQVSSVNYDICKSIMKDQGIDIVEYVNKTEAMKAGRGFINPGNGFVMISPTGEHLITYMHLFRYLERKGLVRL